MNLELSSDTAHESGYTINTPIYEGPLDLLLQLIENAELDITKISLVKVTKPFLDYIRQLQNQQVEEISVFLVVAARLMQIKSEALLPRPPERELGEEDPGDELVQQLLLYKRYKEIALMLEERSTQGMRTYLRLAPPPNVDVQVELEEMDILDLIQAAKDVFNLYEDQKPVGTVVKAPKITISEKIKKITQTLILDGKSSFSKLLGENYSKADIVITFLSLLELVKQYRIQVTQESLFSDIQIETSDHWENGEDNDIELERL